MYCYCDDKFYIYFGRFLEYWINDWIWMSERIGCGWEDNIKIDLLWIWTQQGQDKFQSRVYDNPVMNFQVQ
jgi:hypothetical protein